MRFDIDPWDGAFDDLLNKCVRKWNNFITWGMKIPMWILIVALIVCISGAVSSEVLYIHLLKQL